MTTNPEDTNERMEEQVETKSADKTPRCSVWQQIYTEEDSEWIWDGLTRVATERQASRVPVLQDRYTNEENAEWLWAGLGLASSADSIPQNTARETAGTCSKCDPNRVVPKLAEFIIAGGAKAILCTGCNLLYTVPCQSQDANFPLHYPEWREELLAERVEATRRLENNDRTTNMEVSAQERITTPPAPAQPTRVWEQEATLYDDPEESLTSEEDEEGDGEETPMTTRKHSNLPRVLESKSKRNTREWAQRLARAAAERADTDNDTSDESSASEDNKVADFLPRNRNNE